jgi:hypothetical protein
MGRACRQSRGLDALLGRLGDHPSVRAHRGDHQRELVLPGQQADGDLRLRPPLLWFGGQ